MNKLDLFETVTNRIIHGLSQGVVPWQNPVIEGYPSLPCNIVSGKVYSGVNVLLLAMQKYSSPYFGTFNQIKSLNGKVKSGQRATEIIFWDVVVRHKETREVIDQDLYLALPKEQKLLYEVRPFGRFYQVFNLEQTEGIEPPKATKKLSANQKIKECEKIVSGFAEGPKIEFRPGLAAYYPEKDIVRMPELNAYKNSESFYATLFHELSHATGHSSRLCREGLVNEIKFGSNEYSREELIAEITASFLCAHAKIENLVIDNSIAYLNAWIQALSGDKFMVIKAASEAQKAFNFIVNKGSL